jgi:hypothetical protein
MPPLRGELPQDGSLSRQPFLPRVLSEGSRPASHMGGLAMSDSVPTAPPTTAAPR